MATIVTVANQKGGVGKTTTAVSVAHGLALRERRVLLADFDPQGQCATWLDLAPGSGASKMLIHPDEEIHQWVRPTKRQGLEIIPGDIETGTAQIVIVAQSRPINFIRLLFKPLMKEYDYLILDTAPSVGGIQERAVFASDMVLIPTATEFLSLDGVAKIMEMISRLRKDWSWPGKLLGILPTFFDETTNESKDSIADLREKFAEAMLTPIHRATILRECAAEGKTIFEMKPDHRASQEYETLCREIVKRS